MADPLTLGALGLWGLSTTTSAVLGGTSDRSCLAIVGQIKDRFAGWRGLPANHHVARAVQLAHAQALERVLNVAKADDKGGWSEFPSAERAFYDEMIGEARALHRFADTAKPGDLIYDLGTDLTAAINAVLARPGHDGPATERATTLRAAAQSNALAVIRATIRQRQLSEPPHFEASFVDAQPGRGYISAFGGYIARQIKTNAAFRDIFVVEGLARIEALGFDAVSILAAFEEKLGKGLDEIFEQFKSAQADRDRKHEALLAAIASARGVPSENLRPLFAAVGREVPEADFAGAIEAAVVELIARAERRPDAFNDGEDIRQAIEIARQSLRQLDPNGAIESLRAAQREQAEHRRVHAHGEARLAIEEAEILKVVYRWDEAIAAFERAACLSSDEAWPFFEIGDIWIIRGRIANAASYYERARHVAERANNERDLSVSHDKIGDVLVAEGRLEAAGEAYRSGLVICERLAREDPTNAGLQRDLSVSHNRIGDVLVAEGRLEAAGEAYRSGLVICERLAREDPTNAGLQRDLSVSHDKIGDVLVAEGRLEAAGEAYRSGLVIRERLAREDPTNAGLQRDLSVSNNKIGDVLVAEGRLEAAGEAYRSGLVIRERLAREDPTNAGLQRDLSVSHNKIGDVLVAEGRLEAAGEAYRSGLVIRERLAREDPTNAGLQRDLSVSHDKIGDVLVAEGRLEAAGEAYRSGLVICERLAREDPTNAGLQRDLSVSHDKIGDVLVAEGRLEAAGEAYRSGLVICERLAREDPTNAGLQRDLIVSHVKLAGLGIDSIEHYRTALAIAQTMRTSGRLAPRDQWVIADLEKRLREAQERGA